MLSSQIDNLQPISSARGSPLIRADMKLTDLAMKRKELRKSAAGAKDERRQEQMISMLQSSMALAVSKDKKIMRNLIGHGNSDEQGGSAPNSKRKRDNNPNEIVQSMNITMLASKRLPDKDDSGENIDFGLDIPDKSRKESRKRRKSSASNDKRNLKKGPSKDSVGQAAQ